MVAGIPVLLLASVVMHYVIPYPYKVYVEIFARRKFSPISPMHAVDENFFAKQQWALAWDNTVVYVCHIVGKFLRGSIFVDRRSLPLILWFKFH